MKKFFCSFCFIIIFAILACGNSENTINTDTNVSAPIITYDSLNSPSQITISTTTQDATIYFTTDESIPDENNFLSTSVYTTPFILYESTTLKAIAKKTGLDDSKVVTESLSIIPVTLAVGQTHNFNKIDITLNSVHWYSYKDLYNVPHNTNFIVFEWTVKNNTGFTLSSNPIYSWGIILETPGNTQLNGLYNSGLYTDNAHTFHGYTIDSTTTINDSSIFDSASIDATSFSFHGSAPYRNDNTMEKIGYYFEVNINKIDIKSPLGVCNDVIDAYFSIIHSNTLYTLNGTTYPRYLTFTNLSEYEFKAIDILYSIGDETNVITSSRFYSGAGVYPNEYSIYEFLTFDKITILKVLIAFTFQLNLNESNADIIWTNPFYID